MTKPKKSSIEEKEVVSSSGGKKRGWDDIEQLFDQKKAKSKTEGKGPARDKERFNTKGDSKQSHRRQQDSRPTERDHTAELPSGWVDDGLGGKYNAEGYTGRVEDGVKIFKAHILNKPDAGKTAQCPFDCDCCFI